MQFIDSVFCEKDKIRKFYKKKRLELSKNQKINKDYLIYMNLINLYNYIDSNKIFTYVSKKTEVDTWKLLEHSFNNGKIVSVPKCDVSQNIMNFYLISSVKDLEFGVYGIYEPNISKCKIDKNFSNSLCIVPGLCFDKFGYRVGYGKGYYDKFLKNFKCTKIGLCYSNFILDNIPRNQFDQAVDILVTEKDVIFTR